MSIRMFKLSPLLLLLLMQMQCILGDTEAPEFLKLNDIVTDRIKGVLKQHEDFKTLTDNKEQLHQYKVLEFAASLPISQLDKKILAYNAYLESLEQHQEPNAQLSAVEPNDLSVSLLLDSNKEARAEPLTQFEKDVIKLLNKLGIYDGFSRRVFKALFSNKNQLRRLKKKLAELDEEDNKDCNLWDFVFDLF